MKENRLHYTYATDLHERFDLTKSEAAEIILSEITAARENNYVLIMTSRYLDGKTSFEVFSAEELTHNYMWLHICSQELLNFDDVEHPEGKFCITTFTGIEI